MQIIIISKQEIYTGEIEDIIQLLDAGLGYFHLRKPYASYFELDSLLEKIPSHYHQFIHIHQHYELIDKYKLGGIHHKSNFDLKLIDNNSAKSRSCHSLDELKIYSSKYEYIFLSPIMDSISKIGYKASIELCDIKHFLKENKIDNCIALGGISSDNIIEIKSLGFKGLALLGEIWHKGKNPLSQFLKIKEICTQNK